MAYGASPVDKQLRANWAAFCDRLKLAADGIFKDVNPGTAEHRVDGFRYLTQNLSQAFDLALETKNTKYPALQVFCSPFRKLGGDNADCIYIQSWIDGSSVYKISGTKGSARMWNVAVQGPRSTIAYGYAATKPLHEPFGDTPEVNMFGHELKTNWDGSFELYIGGEKQGQNWLPTTPGTRKLFLRQYFDSFDEEAARYSIERVGMDTPRPVPTVEEMVDAMKWAADFCYDVIDYWPDWGWKLTDTVDASQPNKFAGTVMSGRTRASAEAEKMDARRGRQVAQMRWLLKDDEALILEFDAYDDFWMITCEGVFGNSMDYLYRPISYTPSRTVADSDGKIRFVLTKDDPGYANWIDNQGYNAGSLTFRNIMTRAMPRLDTRVVKAADLARHMPAHSRKFSAAERNAEMHRRFDAIRRRCRI
jgi:hypothetical protein